MTSPPESAGSTLSEGRLAELRELLAKATPGPLVFYQGSSSIWGKGGNEAVCILSGPRRGQGNRINNAELILAAFEDLPALISMADRLVAAERERDEARAQYDALLTSWAESRERHTAAEARASQMAEAILPLKEIADRLPDAAPDALCLWPSERSSHWAGDKPLLTALDCRRARALTAPPPPGAPGSGRA